MKIYLNINEVWEDLNKGKTIYWSNLGYKIYISKSDCEYQNEHFSNKQGRVLEVRFIETYWGGLIEKTEVSGLFSVE